MPKYTKFLHNIPDTEKNSYTPLFICEDYAQIEFPGNFLGNEVIWQAEIRTLRYHSTLNNHSGSELQQFIEISKVGDQSLFRQVTLGLNLDSINNAAILSSMVMLKNYKNLKNGLHQYGDFVSIQ